MAKMRLTIDRAALDAIEALKAQMPPTAAEKVRELIAAERLAKLMNHSKPMIIVTKGGQVRNHAAQQGDVLQAHLADVLKREEIIANLQAKLNESDGTTAAYRSVVADMQGQIGKLQEELGGQDQIARDRRTFAKLLRQTFSIRIGLVSVNIDALMKLVRFPWAKCP